MHRNLCVGSCLFYSVFPPRFISISATTSDCGSVLYWQTFPSQPGFSYTLENNLKPGAFKNKFWRYFYAMCMLFHLTFTLASENFVTVLLISLYVFLHFPFFPPFVLMKNGRSWLVKRKLIVKFTLHSWLHVSFVGRLAKPANCASYTAYQKPQQFLIFPSKPLFLHNVITQKFPFLHIKKTEEKNRLNAIVIGELKKKKVRPAFLLKLQLDIDRKWTVVCHFVTRYCERRTRLWLLQRCSLCKHQFCKCHFTSQVYRLEWKGL